MKFNFWKISLAFFVVFIKFGLLKFQIDSHNTFDLVKYIANIQRITTIVLKK